VPFIIPIASAIAGAISGAIAAVAGVLSTVIGVVAGAVASIASVVASVVAPVIATVVEGVTWIGGTIWKQIGWLADWITTHSKSIYTTISGWVHATYSGVQAILEAIHFKLILDIHHIAYIVSPQYREMMRKVYGAISRASDALGLGPHFLLLAIQNTRQLVLDVSSTLGQKYDLSQVTWLATMNKWLDHFNRYAERYKYNPEAVFWDLAELIERPALDAKGAAQQAWISSLEGALKFTDHLIDQFGKIAIDVDTLAQDLPGQVGHWIYERVNPVTEEFRGFVRDWYTPTVNALQNSLNAAALHRADLQEHVDGLVEELKKPAALITRIKDQPEEERAPAEAYLADLAQQPTARWIDLFMPAVEGARQKLDEMLRKPLPSIPAPPVLALEPVPAHVPSPGALTPRKSWFVGDY